MQLSLAPILLATELGFLFMLAWRCVNRAGVHVGNVQPESEASESGNGHSHYRVEAPV